ncbi:hypothetical protein F511_11558 [Dorcoceras hygrometricum]|uniref:Uncharacterized protein n=1 Tax=Dorcoceras hygrometricum TaxID=472368 RepID=A0A2Z7CUN3_9LAMI|nr:hypothetical protein F511_11558 [Dorcoceras hygrometricum]
MIVYAFPIWRIITIMLEVLPLNGGIGNEGFIFEESNVHGGKEYLEDLGVAFVSFLVVWRIITIMLEVLPLNGGIGNEGFIFEESNVHGGKEYLEDLGVAFVSFLVGE